MSGSKPTSPAYWPVRHGGQCSNRMEREYLNSNGGCCAKAVPEDRGGGGGVATTMVVRDVSPMDGAMFVVESVC